MVTVPVDRKVRLVITSVSDTNSEVATADSHVDAELVFL